MQKTGSLLHDSFSSYSQFKIRCFRGRKPKVDLPAHTKIMITFVQLNYICWNFGKRQLIKFTYHLYATDFEILRFCIFPCHLFSKHKIFKKKKILTQKSIKQENIKINHFFCIFPIHCALGKKGAKFHPVLPSRSKVMFT